MKDENGKKVWKKIRTSPEPEVKKLRIEAEPLQEKKAKLWCARRVLPDGGCPGAGMRSATMKLFLHSLFHRSTLRDIWH